MTDQRIAVVTGANRGIGLEITRQLASQGIHVIATARDPQQGQALVERMAGEGLTVSTFALEVTDAQQCAALRDHVAAEFGRIDILVNNAGIAPDQFVSGFELDLDLYRQILDINVLAPLRLMQLFVPMMKEQGYGRVVNLSSELGSMTTTTVGTTVGYRSSKAALNALSHFLGMELKDYPNIKINAAAPGWCRTDLGGDKAERSAAEGADTPVWLATLDEEGPNGGFFQDRKVHPW